MKDILKRVSNARKEATYAFLKERTTHDFAVFLRDAMFDVKLSLSRVSGVSNEDIDDEKILAGLISDHFRTAFSNDPLSQSDPFLSRVMGSLSSQEPMLHASLVELASHFHKAHEISKNGDQNLKDINEKSRLKRVDEHLSGMYLDAAERAIRMEKKALYELDHGEHQPDALILQGGGAKGFAYSGVVEHLEDRGLLKGITKVGGTSAGALMALPIALGYNSQEINDIVQNGRFAQFFYESSITLKSLTKVDRLLAEEASKRPYMESHLLDDFAHDYLLPALELVSNVPVQSWVKKNEQETQRTLKEMDADGLLKTVYDNAIRVFNDDLIEKGRASEIGILDFGPLLSRSKHFQAVITAIRMARPDSHADSEIVEAFIADIIQEKIESVPLEIRHEVNPSLTTVKSIRNINFSQLKQLADLYPKGNFKEFGVAVTDSYAPVTPVNAVRYAHRLASKMIDRITRKTKEDTGIGVYDKNRVFRPLFVRANNGEDGYIDMPIKKAVRASMNLPVAFRPIKHGRMRLIDGGLTNNFPHRLFRDRFSNAEEANSKTLGFMLSAVETDIEIKQLSDLVRGSKKKPNIILDQGVGGDNEIKNTKSDKGMLAKLTSAMKNKISGMMSGKIENIMGFYNTSTPSIEEMDHVGIINTGLVSMTEFNLSKRGKMDLHRAGVYSSINLNNLDADKDLRFAIGRLISLTSIEQHLIEEAGESEKGASVSRNNPFLKVYDTDSMIAALEKVSYSSWDLSDVLMGRPIAKGSPKGVCLDNICFPDMA